MALEWTRGGEGVVLFGAVLAAVLYVARQAWHAIRAAVQFFHRLERVMINVEQQLYPNGGSTLRDAVDRLQDAAGVENKPPTGGPQ